MDRMEQLDQDVREIMDHVHQQQANSDNRKRGKSCEYRVGDLVWVARPKPLGGHKMRAWWAGPHPMVQRRGKDSYAVQWAPDEILAVHADQLKPWTTDEIPGMGVPLFYHQGEPPSQWPMVVHKVLAHRETHKGLQFLTQWEGAPPSTDTWVDGKEFLHAVPPVWKEYCQQHEIRVEAQ